MRHNYTVILIEILYAPPVTLNETAIPKTPNWNEEMRRDKHP